MARGFNGSTQYLERTSAVITGFPCSLSMWMYLGSTSGEALGLSVYSTTGINLITLDHPSAAIGFRAFAQQAGSSSTSQYRSGTSSTGWHGLAASWATYAQVPNFWIDGVKVTGGTTFTGSGGTMTPTRTGVGSYVFSGTRYYGSMSSRAAWCAMWDAELTDGELKALTQTTPRHPLLVRPQSLQAAWDLGGHYGENDLSRFKGNDLTAYNTPTWHEQPGIIYPRIVNLPQRAAAVGGATPWLYARRRSQIIGSGGIT